MTKYKNRFVEREVLVSMYIQYLNGLRFWESNNKNIYKMATRKNDHDVFRKSFFHELKSYRDKSLIGDYYSKTSHAYARTVVVSLYRQVTGFFKGYYFKDHG